MKKGLIAVAAAVFLASGSLAFAQGYGRGSGGSLLAGMMGGMGGYGGGYGSGAMGGYGSGSGMGPAGTGGYGSGPGSYGTPGTGYPGNWLDRQGNASGSVSGPVSRAQARRLVQDRLTRTGNPNLKIGRVTERNGEYVVDVVTRDNSLVEKIHINKNRGALQRSFK